MSKERPMIFNAEDVRAILDGRRTQTQRVIRPQPEYVDEEPKYSKHTWAFWSDDVPAYRLGRIVRCPYGEPGDRLWVREKFTFEYPYEHADGCGNPQHVIYWATENQIVRDSITSRWRPSIHMPRWACRLTLEVTSVRVEQRVGTGQDTSLWMWVIEFGVVE